MATNESFLVISSLKYGNRRLVRGVKTARCDENLSAKNESGLILKDKA